MFSSRPHFSKCLIDWLWRRNFQQINFYFVQIKFAKVLPWLFLNSRTIVCCINLIKYRLWLFPAKTFFSTKWWGQTEKRGHSFDYSWGSQELVWEKTFHDGSYNLIRDPRPLSIPTRIPRKLNKLHFQDTSTVVFVLTIFRANNTPSPKTRKFAVFFLSAKKENIFKGLPGPKYSVFQLYCFDGKKWKLSFQAISESPCGIKWDW